MGFSRRIFIATGAATLLAGCATPSIPRSAEPTQLPSPAVTPPANSPTVTPTAQTPTVLRTIHTDPEYWSDHLFTVDDQCWSIWCDGQERVQIRVDSLDGRSAQYKPEFTAPSALTASSTRTPDGAVWIALTYALVRIAEGKATTFGLNLEVEDQLPGATDRNAPLAGTWATALAPDGEDGVLLARLNVARLTRVARDGSMSRGPAVPVDFAGSRDLTWRGSELFLAQGWLAEQSVGIGVLTGEDVRVLDAPGVVESEGDYGLTNSSVVELGSLREEGAPDPAASLWRSGPDGDRAWWDQAEGSLVSLQRGTVKLDEKLVEVAGPPPAEGPAPPPVATRVGERLTDLGFDERGTLWILRDGGRRLDAWQ